MSDCVHWKVELSGNCPPGRYRHARPMCEDDVRLLQRKHIQKYTIFELYSTPLNSNMERAASGHCTHRRRTLYAPPADIVRTARAIEENSCAFVVFIEVRKFSPTCTCIAGFHRVHSTSWTVPMHGLDRVCTRTVSVGSDSAPACRSDYGHR